MRPLATSSVLLRTRYSLYSAEDPSYTKVLTLFFLVAWPIPPHFFSLLLRFQPSSTRPSRLYLSIERRCKRWAKGREKNKLKMRRLVSMGVYTVRESIVTITTTYY